MNDCIYDIIFESKAYSGPYQTFMIERFDKIVNDEKLFLLKSPIKDIWEGLKNAFVKGTKEYTNIKKMFF